MAMTTEPPRLLLKAMVGLYLLEAALIVVGVMLHKAAGIPELATRSGLVFLIAAAAGVAGTFLLIAGLRPPAQRRSGFLTIALNLVSVALVIGTAELGLRIARVATPGFDALFPRSFLPRDWDEVAAANQELLARATRGDSWGGSFLVHDPRLGWTVGPSRTSHDGLYASSVEGLRSARPGDSYDDARALRRIAIVGDSYTFGMSVAFEDTWGERLRSRLGADFAVLNFGVDGYGVDQAYLRYVEEASAWHPEIVILGLISHDVYRTTVVYPFIAFPSWQFPFSKPRFTQQDGELQPVNLPLANPADLFASARIEDLPYIDLEPAYFAPDWSRHWFDRLYSVRALLSIAPRWPAPAGDRVLLARQLNAALLREFVATAERRGSMPVIVYFPSYGSGELGPAGGSRPRGVRAAHATLAEARVDYLDMIDCLRDTPPSVGLAPDGAHYSATSNALVAECLHNHLGKLGIVPMSAAAATP